MTYEEYDHSDSIGSEATASEASLDYEGEDGYRHSLRDGEGKERLEDEEEGGEGFELDEEEQVGLMQRDRDGTGMGMGRFDATIPRSLTFPSRKGRVGWKSGGGFIFLGVLLSLFVSIPCIYWLSSATSESSIASFPDAGGPGLKNLTVSGPKVTKQLASKNDEKGRWGLSHAKGFKVDFHIPGWSSISEAARISGIDQRELEKELEGIKGGLRQLTMDSVMKRIFSPKQSDLAWSEEDPDEGVFTHVDWLKRDIYVQDVTHARKEKTGKGEVAKNGGKVLYVEGKNVKDHRGRSIRWDSFKISPDMKWVMFFSETQRQWRYSSHSNVWLHNVGEKMTLSLGDGQPSETTKPSISFAAWAPKPPESSTKETTGVAFVQGNNLYYCVKPGSPPIRVTTDGAASIFNAVPDWVYEEEVFAGDSAMWFSPGGTKLVYLRLDETDVPVYEYPIYNPSHYEAGKTTPYLETVKMKYPKPGYPNPLVSVHMVDLVTLAETEGRPEMIESAKRILNSPNAVTPASVNQEAHDVDLVMTEGNRARERIVIEVEWVNDEELLLKETDRVSDVMRVVLFDTNAQPSSTVGPGGGETTLQGQVVRWQDARKRNAWIEAAQTMEPLTHHNLSLRANAYLDVMISPEGYRHLAFFDQAKSGKPTFITRGAWEVEKLEHVDVKRRKAYFIAARPGPGQRNLYSVRLPDWSSEKAVSSYKVEEPVPMTGDKEAGYHGVSFDPKGAYYTLYYKGPGVPYQKVLGIDDSGFELVLEDNAHLAKLSAQYVKPEEVFYNITTEDGVEVSVKEVRPHDFDASGKTRYPVLINVYGGPDSQKVDSRWDRSDWHQYLACGLGYVTAFVDGRGTGFKGEEYRSGVTGRLGHLESIDVNAAARRLASLAYVDESRMGVWGWSYGGYLTNKVVERDEGTLGVAIAVAPVTKWEFYDSVYTERYMKDVRTNWQGYSNASVHVTSGFSRTELMLAQGTGDDNVHFENSAHLVDLLTWAKVRSYRFRMFTDSDHSISTRGAWEELHHEMTRFLMDKWGVGGKRVGQEGGGVRVGGWV
ncbi:hypothetical protein IE53DRAFT_385868 [Violaceomyces palustris]|uniref:Uncharacterized protein n=1 Tax=Violaceomyces palustris TaxID=1673888 RepID=A0ACD0P0V0_9BASI|nr:hypothetical protein IE53DRAFT_385868 [Violaceomyces palustris]